MLKDGTFTSKKFRRVFIAALLGWVVSLLGSMADSIIAGMFLDSEAVSAVGLITPITSIVYFFSLAIGVGSAILYSRTLGAFDVEESKKIAGMGLILAVSLSVIMSLVLLIFKTGILNFYGVHEDGYVWNYASDYYTPVILISAIYPILWTLYYLVSYDGDEKLILLADIMTAVSNAGLSLILVQMKSGFLSGISGLGYGTFFSNIIGILCVIPHFLKKSNSIRFKPYFSFSLLWKMIKVSSAISLITLYMGIVDIVFNKIVIVFFGEEYLTAYAVINVVMNFACALNCAINAGIMFVSVAYGENNTFALKRIMKLTNKYAIGTGIIMTIVSEFLASLWPKLYAIEPGPVYDCSVFAGRIVPAFFITAAFVYTYLTYYPTVGKTIEGNILVISYMLIGPLVISVPLAKISFNAMSLGFGITPIFAIAVTFIYILITKQIKNFPYLIHETNASEAHYDLRYEPESIIQVRDKIGEFLKDQNISDTVINKIKVTFEDTLVFIMKKNKKNIIGEVTLLVDDKYVKMISKDNGIIFDIIKEADDAVDFQAYVLARMMQNAREASNSTTTSFNRNVCVWEK